jgi:hypothetical protein
LGKSSQEKGRRGEYLLRDELRRLGFDEVNRGSVFQHTSDLTGLEGIHVEAKFCEKLNIRAALLQAEDEAKKRNDGMPTVFSKTSRKPWIVTMNLDDWAKLYEAYLNRLPFE